MSEVPEIPLIPVYVNGKGGMRMSDGAKALLAEWLCTFEGHGVLSVKQDRSLLSERQRRWYFGQVLHRILKKTGQDKDDLHLYFKQKYLGNPEDRHIVIVDAQGQIIDEANTIKDTSITVLTTKDMARYCDQIRDFAADRLDVYIPNPDKQWRTAA